MILRSLINEAASSGWPSRSPPIRRTPTRRSRCSTDLRTGIWANLKANAPDLDLYRRNLQRAHAELLIGEVNKDNATSDLPALARGELRALLADIDACKDKKVPPTTRFFLDDLRVRIAQALEPKAILQGGGRRPLSDVLQRLRPGTVAGGLITVSRGEGLGNAEVAGEDRFLSAPSAFPALAAGTPPTSQSRSAG